MCNWNTFWRVVELIFHAFNEDLYTKNLKTATLCCIQFVFCAQQNIVHSKVENIASSRSCLLQRVKGKLSMDIDTVFWSPWKNSPSSTSLLTHLSYTQHIRAHAFVHETCQWTTTTLILARQSSSIQNAHSSSHCS